MVFAFVGVAAIGGYGAASRSANYKPATASVVMIDRTCNFTETTTDENGKKTMRGVTDSCNSTGEWGKVREERSKRVSGKATVHLQYIAPQDGEAHTAQLKFTGGDDEFYEIKAGDQIKVLVRNDDLDKVTLA
ncbi:hypothetical protein G7078_10735 [Sphingomonas sinipercae]|uniref:Uncharacterized protein n=1 Tax=Sphingomonas sinipercae TaxID=2714944 RepID=A0A6G7ZQK2_9SPHN|nr:hypothetical protein [Sphingomonas sinipercae]QIL03205.1 hypothetical protein G7078_10735 [Sphingomonas sinipercae]